MRYKKRAIMERAPWPHRERPSTSATAPPRGNGPSPIAAIYRAPASPG